MHRLKIRNDTGNHRLRRAGAENIDTGQAMPQVKISARSAIHPDSG
jgi:hypothetical protein